MAPPGIAVVPDTTAVLSTGRCKKVRVYERFEVIEDKLFVR